MPLFWSCHARAFGSPCKRARHMWCLRVTIHYVNRLLVQPNNCSRASFVQLYKRPIFEMTFISCHVEGSGPCLCQRVNLPNDQLHRLEVVPKEKQVTRREVGLEVECRKCVVKATKKWRKIHYVQVEYQQSNRNSSPCPCKRKMSIKSIGVSWLRDLRRFL